MRKGLAHNACHFCIAVSGKHRIFTDYCNALVYRPDVSGDCVRVFRPEIAIHARND